MRLTMLLFLTVISAGCSTAQQCRVVDAATPAQQAALLERVKALAGTWEGEAPDGTTGTTIFQVTSNGSAVREIMLSGTEHEMTNMYTMDGPDLLMTHYCAMGNQPHMRAAAGSGNRIEFKPAGVSNLTAPEKMYMGQMTIEFVDADHIKQHWQSLKEGHPGDHNLTIELTRKR